MRKKCNFEMMEWVNQPERSIITRKNIIIETKPETDFWGKTYYNYTYENAPALVMSLSRNFSFSAHVYCDYKHEGDQSGILVIANDDNWFKVCAQYHDDEKMALCAVVNQHGFSDYSSVLISSGIHSIYFRVEQLNEDYKIEYSFNGKSYRTMRFFHLKNRTGEFKVGIYAASPLDSSFDATFDECYVDDCYWKEYKGEIV